MSSWTNRETGIFWRMGLVAIVLWAVPASLWSQVNSFTQQASSDTGHPFAGFDEFLTKAADTLLASAEQATTVTQETRAAGTAGTGFAIHFDRQPRSWGGSWGGGGERVAAARLDMLRPVIEPILRSHGVPVELAAVVLVESAGRATALSPKGARGLWQLMPETARRYGLRVDELQDDRLDLFRATYAAARYLHDLYAQFGDWKLALAAYNAGEASVGSAILRAHTQDFDQLTSLRMLPLETRNYVPRVLAAAQSFGQPSPFADYHRTARTATIFALSAVEDSR